VLNYFLSDKINVSTHTEIHPKNTKLTIIIKAFMFPML
jgi:hypothetical protein